MGVSEQTKGLILAISSSVFIGSSFIVKKKGLRRAGASGLRAGSGGYSYLYEPLWWAGFLSMVVGELANFAAYAFAPAILVTPLGALSILVSAVLAHFLLNERLNGFGAMGCILCVTGSLAIILHAPEEQVFESIPQVWALVVQPGFLLYAASAVAATLLLIFRVPPDVAASNPLVPIAICSAVGSLSVMACKALGLAVRLTLAGSSQLGHPATWAFAATVVVAVLTQMAYLNRALDLHSTALVTPLYYAGFTSLTLLASAVLFGQAAGGVAAASQASGFLTILCGTTLLHATRDADLAALAPLLGLARRAGEDQPAVELAKDARV
ncbi:hypothetical protein ACKKBF_B19605 [Auxenochlorella protothecoides x Auxenochlorella symbiontica]